MDCKNTEERVAENPWQWLKDWKIWFTMKSWRNPVWLASRLQETWSPSGRRCVGNTRVVVNLPDPSGSLQKGFQGTLQPHCRVVLSPLYPPHDQPMFGGTRWVQTQNIAGWRLLASQGLRGNGDTFFLVKNVQNEMSVFSERSFPGIDSRSAVACASWACWSLMTA